MKESYHIKPLDQNDIWVREGKVISLFALTIYLFIILLDYNINCGISSCNIEDVWNIGGNFGFKISHIIFYVTGIASWILVVFSAILLITHTSLNTKPRSSWYRKIITLIGIMLGLMSSSMLSRLALGEYYGGYVGESLFLALYKNLGSMGSYIFALAVLCLSLTMMFNAPSRYWLGMLSFRPILHYLQEKCRTIGNIFKPNTSKKIFKNSHTEKVKNKKKIDVIGFKKDKVTLVTASSVKNDVLPKISLLKQGDKNNRVTFSNEEIKNLGEILESSLASFGIQAKVEGSTQGPVVTRFEMMLASGVKASRITSLESDLARMIKVENIRVIENIRGTDLVGLELPNSRRQSVYLRELLETQEYRDAPGKLVMALGQDTSGKGVYADLSAMPHLLIAGTTGSGKSVAVNAMILSLLYRYSADDMRLILIDPKMLELVSYNDIPHLLTPVVIDMSKASTALNWCVNEMERRYKLMSMFQTRSIDSFNEYIACCQDQDKPAIDPDNPEEVLQKMPFIVVVVDELADLMVVAGKQVESLIVRLAQKARAAGIHMILATQRPSADVITGLIKSNVPSRMGFKVSSGTDSRIILDQRGAERLLGYGDMLFFATGSPQTVRLHSAFVSDEEVTAVTNSLKKNHASRYIEQVTTSYDFNDDDDEEEEELYNQAVSYVRETRKSSVSAIQRKFRIGYNRAARMVDIMERKGVVSQSSSNGSREIL